MNVLKSINPYNQELVEEYPVFTSNQIQFALSQAEIAFRHWKNTTYLFRSNLLLKLAEVLQENSEKYALHIALEMGKILAEARAEVEKCAKACIYYAQNGATLLQDQSISITPDKAIVTHEPLGAVCAIMPWNFPFWQAIRFAVPTTFAGNVILLKHASNVSRCALDIEEAFLLAGFPKGVLQTLLITSARVEELISNDVVRGVTLTGSEAAGASVASLAGKYIKPAVLELGGSDPFIVLDDANIQLAAQIATASRMQNAGQSCIAAKRFIVSRKIHDEFVTAFEREVKKIKQGNQLEATTTMGPLSSPKAANNLYQQQIKSIEKGAIVIAGLPNDNANYYPTILDNVNMDSPAFQEELFGPVAAIVSIENAEQAVEVANKSCYGLGATLFSADLDKADYYARRINSGSVFINSIVKSDPQLPFGGVKRSGFGRELSKYGLTSFTNIKTIYRSSGERKA